MNGFVGLSGTTAIPERPSNPRIGRIRVQTMEEHPHNLQIRRIRVQTSKHMIPLVDHKIQYQRLKPEIDAAMQQAAANAAYILGPNVKALEAEIAAYCSCQYGIGVANGTDALHLALRALRIAPGDEVITTPFTFVATTEAIGMVGARPVFVDIDP